MISVRYHIVSIAAVFLALTVGILLGSTSVSERLLSTVGGERDALGEQVGQLRAERDSLRTRLTAADRFGASIAPLAAQGQLDHRTVALISTGDADPHQREAVRKMLTEAGAQVTGEVQLTESFADRNREEQLRQVVTQLLPAGVQLPADSDPGTLAGGLLGPLTLLNPQTGTPQTSPEERTAALRGLTEGGFVRVAQDVEPAQLAIVLTGGGRAEAEESGATTVARFAAQVDRAGAGAVLAGARGSADGNGPLGVVRADPTMSSILSTVDNIDVPAGRLAAVLALREQAEGRSGQYGDADGAQGPSPDGRG